MGGWRSPQSSSPWSLQVSLFPHLAWQGIVPNLCLLVVVAAALTVEAPFALLLGFTAGRPARPRPACRPRRRPLGARPHRRRVPRRAAAPGRQAHRPRRRRHGGRSVLRRDLALRAHRHPARRPRDVGVGAAAGRARRRRVGRAAHAVRAAATDEALRPAQSRSGPSSEGHAAAAGLRLVVVQALVFSLFATLFVRLYYLQVVGGESYQAQAANQSVRDIVVQPQRGLIVDDQGRPLVTNRTSWVVSVDRTLLGKLAERQRTELLRRVAVAVEVAPQEVQDRLVTCGDPGSIRDVCWNGSPYQPVPVATDVSKDVALRVLEQPEDYPGVLAEQQNVRSYPAPLRHQPRARPGIPQSDHRGRVRPRLREGRPFPQRCLGRRSRRCGEAVRRVAARTAGLPPGRGRLDGSGAGRRLDRREHARRHAGHLDRRQGAGRRRGRARALDPHPARTPRHGHRPQLRRRCGRRRRPRGPHRSRGRHGQPADVRPGRLGRRHHLEGAGPPLLREGRHPAALPRHPGAVRARLHVEALHDRRCPEERLQPGHHPAVLLGLPGRQPGLQELRVRRLRQHRFRAGARRLLQHLLLPRRLQLLAAFRLRRRRRRCPRPAGRGGQGLRLRAAHRHRPARARPPAGSPTGPGSAPTTSR